MISDKPYQFTSEDVIFNAFAVKNDVDKAELANERERFFPKGQACMRTSPLTKRYGFGIHYDEKGRMALYPVESEEYKKPAADKTLAHVKAMCSKKA